jgi:hypothetical protein
MSKARVGKTHSAATKEVMHKPHAFAKRKPLRQETKDKIRAAMLGKHHSEETKQRIREALLAYEELRKQGILPRFKHTPETIALLREMAQGRVPSAACLAASAVARKEKAFRKKMKHQVEIGFYN